MSEKILLQFFITLLTAFILTVLIAPGFIPMLRRMKFGQEVREEGPEAHLKKQGTPTMGGIMFLISISCAVLISSIGFGINKETLQILFLFLGFGLVGFADDYLKIKKHQSEGLNPKQKLVLQLVLTLIFLLWVYYGNDIKGRVYVPFMGIGENTRFAFELPVWLFIPFGLFVVLGIDNGVNFTDGLDGLCSSVTVIAAAFFAVAGILTGNGTFAVAGAVIGALCGFLLFNVYPAKVFMGDTGSLALGGFIAASAVVGGLELYVPIVGFIYMIEVISVIIQVTYFKATHGKRFFKMAPIHHHFELLGNSETRIVAAFTIITFLLSFAAVIGMIV